MYDQKTDTQTSEESVNGYQRQANPVGHANGQHYPVHLRIGYGNKLYAWTMGKGSGQRRDLQDDFTRFFYTYRRHDWVPVWYQTHAK